MGCGGGGGGGCGQVVGIVVTAVATYFTAGLAAGAIGSTLLGSEALAGAAAWGIGGAVGGALGAGVSGGNVGRGAMMGALGGAIGGGMGWYGDATQISSANLTNGSASATTAAPAAASAPVAGGEASFSGNAMDNAMNSYYGNNGTNFSSLDGSAGVNGAGTTMDSLNAGTGAGAGASAGGDTVNLANSTQMTSGAANPATTGGTTDYTSAFGPQGAGLNTSGAPVQQSFGDKLTQSAKDMWDKATSSEGMKKAGLQLGTQALAGAIAPGPDMSQMNSYLNDMKGMQQQAQEFNMNMANKKAAIGDNMAQTADNYNPEYYALQSQTQSKNRRASQWADTESQLRAQGYDQNYINAMKNKYDVDSSQAAGSAYDSGWQTGQNARQSAYQAAGGMYTGVSSPTAGLSGDYMSLYKQKQDSINGIANTVSKATGQEPDSMK